MQVIVFFKSLILKFFIIEQKNEGQFLFLILILRAKLVKFFPGQKLVNLYNILHIY